MTISESPSANARVQALLFMKPLMTTQSFQFVQSVAFSIASSLTYNRIFVLV
eukprot:m.84243 g.84243  ORF g.84243 m.84243 type:complete len:52 (+) comp36394_c0_seq2:281-436(+)